MIAWLCIQKIYLTGIVVTTTASTVCTTLAYLHDNRHHRSTCARSVYVLKGASLGFMLGIFSGISWPILLPFAFMNK